MGIVGVRARRVRFSVHILLVLLRIVLGELIFFGIPHRFNIRPDCQQTAVNIRTADCIIVLRRRRFRPDAQFLKRLKQRIVRVFRVFDENIATIRLFQQQLHQYRRRRIARARKLFIRRSHFEVILVRDLQTRSDNAAKISANASFIVYIADNIVDFMIQSGKDAAAFLRLQSRLHFFQRGFVRFG